MLKSGQKVRLSFPHSTMSVVTFTAVIAKEEQSTVVVRIPERIRKMQWSPYTGKYYRFNKADFAQPKLTP